MKARRPTLIYIGLIVLAGAAWFAIAVTFVITSWWIAVGVVPTFVACNQAEQAISRRLDRPRNRRGRRRAHARPRTLYRKAS
ncbi:hypothetical protein [Streptomyces sp. NPDC093269]|uniref:hypothetical protein n=1 Tax=Streptomyces sp. NPDC093269 TaxID=3366038 RepID=UPI0038244C32